MSRAGVALLASLVVLAAAIGLRLAQPERFAPPPLPVLDTLGGDFALPGTRGTDTRIADFRGRLVLLTFGFATCPDVCPTVLSRMRQAILELGDAATEVQPLFVTLDPERDTLERLAPFVRHFHPAFVALRGTPEQTRAAAALFKVYYEREEMPPPMDYGIAHSDHIYLLDRAGRVRATFASNVLPAEIAAAMRRLLEEPDAR
jgi:protein SCO1/2